MRVVAAGGAREVANRLLDHVANALDIHENSAYPWMTNRSMGKVPPFGGILPMRWVQ